MTTNRAIRASDQDREHVVDILRTQYSEGRLTLDEFDERITAAYAGKTWGDLLDLTRDLPDEVRLGADQAPAAAGDQRAPAERSLWPAFRLVPLVPLLLAAVLLSSLAWGGMGHGPGHHHFVPFFPIWPLLLITLLFLRSGRWRRRGWHR